MIKQCVYSNHLLIRKKGYFRKMPPFNANKENWICRHNGNKWRMYTTYIHTIASLTHTYKRNENKNITFDVGILFDMNGKTVELQSKKSMNDTRGAYFNWKITVSCWISFYWYMIWNPLWWHTFTTENDPIIHFQRIFFVNSKNEKRNGKIYKNEPTSFGNTPKFDK